MTAEVELDESPCPTIVVNIKKRLTGLIEIDVEPVGKWFHAHELARVRNRSVCLDDLDEEISDGEDGDSDKPEIQIKDDISYLRSLDPADWKNQDHYAVLGLKEYRYKASDDDIKRAYRMMVLKHHPDKRKGAGEEIREGDDYFTCITKAYEILGVPSKRMSYDSVDPEFDEFVPTVAMAKKEGFFQTFGPVIERNARWSTRKRIPHLGGADDPKEKVDRFYKLWFDFDSWREFSYLDEEEKEKGQDREERRWIEKQNKADRLRRRREEQARLRKLIENCYTADPRIARFKEEEKERRLAAKRAKQEAIRQKAEQEQKARDEEAARIRKLKEAEEAELKARQEAEKRQREAEKKILKKERKTLRTTCSEHQYFTGDDGERVDVMTDVEFLCEALQTAQLRDFNERLVAAASDPPAAKTLILDRVRSIKSRHESEREAQNCAAKAASVGNAASAKSWTNEDIQILIKAVNLFPAGTSQRWEVVSEYLKQHSSSGTKWTAKDVLSKAKQLQTSDQQIKEAARKNILQTSDKHTPGLDNSSCSVRMETPQEMLGMNLSAWSAEEQRLLEQALKTFSASTADRWDRIAECVPNRSKKECMKRYKELVDMVKAKKAAQVAASKR